MASAMVADRPIGESSAYKPSQAAPAAYEAYAPHGFGGRTAQHENTTADQIAASIVTASATVADMLTRGCDQATDMIARQAARQVETRPPTSRPYHIAPQWRSRVNIAARVASFVAAAATQVAELTGRFYYMLIYLGIMAYKMISSIAMGHNAPTVGDPAEGLRALFVSKQEKTAFKVVGAALLVAYIRVYDAFEVGGTKVFGALRASATSLVDHRYGTDASALAKDVFGLFESLVASLLVIWRQTFKAFLNTTTQQSAVAYLRKHVRTARDLKFD